MAGTKQDMIIYHPRRLAIQKKMQAHGDPKIKNVAGFKMIMRKFRKRKGIPKPMIRRGG